MGEHEVDDERARRGGVGRPPTAGRAASASTAPATTVTTRTSTEAGSRRRARRAQKLGSETVPVAASSRSSSRVIRKPDTTKNTSTPTNPPLERGRSGAWNSTHDDDGDRAQALDVGPEVVLGDAGQRTAHRVPLGRHLVVIRRLPWRGPRRRTTGDHGGHAAARLTSGSSRSWGMLDGCRHRRIRRRRTGANRTLRPRGGLGRLRAAPRRGPMNGHRTAVAGSTGSAPRLVSSRRTAGCWPASMTTRRCGSGGLRRSPWG